MPAAMRVDWSAVEHEPGDPERGEKGSARGRMDRSMDCI